MVINCKKVIELIWAGQRKLRILKKNCGQNLTLIKNQNIDSLIKIKIEKIFTAGPASLVENLIGISPSFGRGDLEYENR